jgi:hypothetical protein
MEASVVRRLYLYVAAFFGLILMANGLSSLISILALHTANNGLFEPGVAARLSNAAALALVGVPLWLGHWLVIQRRIQDVEERQSAIRRLYLYLVLTIAALTMLFALRDIVSEAVIAFYGSYRDRNASVLIGRFATLLVFGLIWGYHWQVAAADREQVEAHGQPATLRRLYMLVVMLFSLAVGAVGLAELIDTLISLSMRGNEYISYRLGSTMGFCIAGLSIWYAHQRWSQQLVLRESPLRDDERNSPLRRFFLILVIAIVSISGLASLGVALAGLVRLGLGGITFADAFVERSMAVGGALASVPLWLLYRRQFATEARLRPVDVRDATAWRIGSYLSLAASLVALYIGMSGALATLLQLVFAAGSLADDWRDTLSNALATVLIATPIFWLFLRRIAQRLVANPEEERMLSRRVYLYIALLFGIFGMVVPLIGLLSEVLQALLGQSDQWMLTNALEAGAYAVCGGAIAVGHTLWLRRSNAARGTLGQGRIVVIAAGGSLATDLAVALEREAPGATIHTPALDNPAELQTALAQADALVVSLAVLDQPGLRSMCDRSGAIRVVVPTSLPGYTLVGVSANQAVLIREAVRAVREVLRERAVQAPAASLPGAA